MSNEVLRFLCQLTVVSGDKELLDEIESILHTPNKIFQYIVKGGLPLISKTYRGVSADGSEKVVKLEIPKELHQPPPLSDIVFTSTRTAAGLTFTPKTNYLPTFDVTAFLSRSPPLDLGSVEGIDYRIITYLLGSAGYQSRVGSIWKQTAAMVAVGRAYLQPDHPGLPYYQLLLSPFGEPPFFERGERIEWVNQQGPVNSILPLLLHGAGQLIILSLLEVLEPIDAVACIQHWLTCMKKNFQDTKLQTQKCLRNWLPVALDRLPVQKVPVWSLTGDLTGWKWKTPREPALLLKTLKDQRKISLANLDSVTREYVESLQSPRTFTQLMRAYHVGRVMANDGTFFGSITEVTIDAAVLPRACGTVLPTMSPLSRLDQNQVLLYDQMSSPPFMKGYVYLRRAFRRWQEDSRELMENLNHEVLGFLTTSSAGTIPEHLMLPLSADPRLKKAGKKRVIAFVSESAEIRNLERFRTRLTEPVLAVERTQIGRRARAVAGVNNPRILASLPFLRAAERLQKILRHASSGKQKGSVADIARMMHYWTVLDNVLLSSMDVSGFDASVQMVSQTQFISMISEVLGPMARGRYLCYDQTRVTQSDGSTITVPAFQVLAADVMSRFQPQSTVVKGRVLEYKGLRPYN